MKEVPARIQCAYCKRNSTHGGECHNPKYEDKTCIIFVQDERGCIRNDDLNIPVLLYSDLPILNTWIDDWELRGVPTQIKINTIKGLRWDSKKGRLIIIARCDYFINEFHEDYIESKEKPKLTLVK